MSSSVRSFAVACLVAAAGCDQVFGLNPRMVDAPADVSEPDAWELRNECEPQTGDLDEDGDGVLNRFDVCPIIQDLAQLDTDNDRVGDSCDPHDTFPDTIFSVGYFIDRFGCWSPGGSGDWSVPNGSVTANRPATLMQIVETSLPVTLEMGFSFTAVPATSTFSIFLNTPTGSFECRVHLDTTGGGKLNAANGSQNGPAVLISPVGTGLHRITLVLESTSMTCSLDGAKSALVIAGGLIARSAVIFGPATITVHHTALYGPCLPPCQ